MIPRENTPVIYICVCHTYVLSTPGWQSQHQMMWYTYGQTCNISRTLVGNEIVDHSDVVGASPVGAALTTFLFST